MSERKLRAASAFSDLRGSAGRSNAGVWICERQPQLATVIPYKGRRADVCARLKAGYDLSLPDGPRRTASGASAVIGLGPRTWLFEREASASFGPELANLLGDAAAVTDQSDGYAVLRLTGPYVRRLLEKGVSLDLDDRVFVPGAAAVTSCAHLGVILWRLEDDNSFAVFDLAVFRSLARSLQYFIRENSAEFGLAVFPEH